MGDISTVLPNGTTQTAGKAIIAAIVTTVAVSLAPAVADFMSSINADPEWIKNCVTSKSISSFAVLGFGLLSGGTAGVLTYLKRNFVAPKT